jgi:hypothetical protein
VRQRCALENPRSARYFFYMALKQKARGRAMAVIFCAGLGMGTVENVRAEVAHVAISEKKWSPVEDLQEPHGQRREIGDPPAPLWRFRVSSWVPMDYSPSAVPGLSVAHVRGLESWIPAIGKGWDALVDVQWRLFEKNGASQGRTMILAELGLQKPWTPTPESALEWVLGFGAGPVAETDLGWIAHAEFSVSLRHLFGNRFSGQPQIGGQVSVGRLGPSRLEGFGLHVGISL